MIVDAKDIKFEGARISSSSAFRIEMLLIDNAMCIYLVLQLLTFLHLLPTSTFAQAPLLNDPVTAITVDELNAAFEGCNMLAQRAIFQAHWDAAALLNRPNVRNAFPNDQGINWNLPAAIECLGSLFNRPYQKDIQGTWA
jgi:hypothetical protein